MKKPVLYSRILLRTYINFELNFDYMNSITGKEIALFYIVWLQNTVFNLILKSVVFNCGSPQVISGDFVKGNKGRKSLLLD